MAQTYKTTHQHLSGTGIDLLCFSMLFIYSFFFPLSSDVVHRHLFTVHWFVPIYREVGMEIGVGAPNGIHFAFRQSQQSDTHYHVRHRMFVTQSFELSLSIVVSILVTGKLPRASAAPHNTSRTLCDMKTYESWQKICATRWIWPARARIWWRTRRNNTLST